LPDKTLGPYVVDPLLVGELLGFFAAAGDDRIGCGAAFNARGTVRKSGFRSKQINALRAVLLLKEQADLPIFRSSVQKIQGIATGNAFGLPIAMIRSSSSVTLVRCN